MERHFHWSVEANHVSVMDGLSHDRHARCPLRCPYLDAYGFKALVDRVESQHGPTGTVGSGIQRSRMGKQCSVFKTDGKGCLRHLTMEL